MNFQIFNLFMAMTILCSVIAPALAVGNECDTVCYGGPMDVCKKCASYCPRTCDNYDTEYSCIAICKVDTCECDNTTVRDEKTGQCVLTGQCPKKSIFN